jgi:hypothetical protein
MTMASIWTAPDEIRNLIKRLKDAHHPHLSAASVWAQGFPDSYVIDHDITGRPITKTGQVRMVGNSVSPVMSEALAAANLVPKPDNCRSPQRAGSARRAGRRAGHPV